MTEIKNKPLILISNDDGVEAKGINELIKAMLPLGDIVVVAPDGPRSGMSSAITSIKPLQIRVLEEKEGLKIYSCSGTPVDCVKLGINELLDKKPDLVVTGINHGSNASICVLYSGTMGAAMEGCIFGIPSIGFSLTDLDSDANFNNAAHYAAIVSAKVLAEGLPNGVCLNVNVPNVDEIKGIKICTQTGGQWIKEFYTTNGKDGETQYWLTGEFDNFEPNNEESDEWALANGFVSIVPTKIDLTSHEMINKLKNWEI